MEQTTRDAVDAILAKDTWGAEDHKALLSQLVSMDGAPSKLKAALGQWEASFPEPKGGEALKIGIARYMLCRFRDALAAFASATDNKDRHYYQALCHKQLAQYAEAAQEFQKALDRGWEDKEIRVQLIEIQAITGQLEAANKALAAVKSKLGESADYYYLRGRIDEIAGLGEQAVASYEKAHDLDPDHAATTFRLAYYYDLHGDEEEAIELYKECISHPPVHASALMNLAVLYEDDGQYDQAVRCLRSVLATNPSHLRARLFLKDTQASTTMYYDEDQAKRIAKRNAVLDIPVTDFELSVRARNCLKKMNIRTLGDLVRTTEAELLSYKNFGETSLKEIKDMLTAKGLRLGQELEESGVSFDQNSLVAPAAATAATTASPLVGNEGMLATPIDRVEFSVRARRALESLKIRTLGDLASRTEAELLACRNFGQTSLNEVRQRLAEYGLQLRDLNA